MGFIYGYESIPINSIFSGMNIHLPAILMFTRGTRVLTHPHIYIYIHGILMDVNGIFMGFDVFLKDFHWISMGWWDFNGIQWDITEHNLNRLC